MNNIFNLPELDFGIESTTTILNRLLATLKENFNLSFTPSDPYYVLLSGIAYFIALEKANIAQKAKQCFLSYMEENYLDNWGANNDCVRLEAIPATTTLQFTLSEELEEDLTIPTGTRVQSSNGVTFATTDNLIIPAGETVGTVQGECTEAGLIGNGYTVGQINYIMNPLASVETTVANTTITSGGFDVESDDDYKLRIRSAFDSFSTAGSMASYNYWAKSMSLSIVDVDSYTPSAGCVNICVLTKDGALGTDSELYTRLQEFLGNTNSTKRPMTDNVTIETAEAVNYTIDLTYWIYSTDTINQDTIRTNVLSAINSYIDWQKAKLGRGIDPSELIKLVKNAGAKRVEVRQPASYVALSNHQYAQVTGTNSIIEGGFTS